MTTSSDQLYAKEFSCGVWPHEEKSLQADDVYVWANKASQLIAIWCTFLCISQPEFTYTVQPLGPVCCRPDPHRASFRTANI
ncbi:hypothetical protein PoB_001274000 [Plakobranchus ocellatus]|uniref:Uncharacterized protein n=1 Tax=Plakobranchus ocellatus TaxID=259542 RepID=A0AAV3YTV4_9GAST|nr:hypothetical protein PoB_001274000 [Plakobranchus ocellatus]